MTRSLRSRLFIGLTAIIILTGAISAIFAYNWAFDEAIEIQDSLLIQLASLAQNGSFSGGQPVPKIEEDAQVWLVELGNIPHGSPDNRQLFGLTDGLHTASHNGQLMRVLLRTRSDGSRYAVAQPTAIRDGTARDMAVRTLLPIAALIPCLMVMTALVVARSLRPMIRLAGDLDARRADDLTPLPLAGMPSELHPFVVSMNGLLVRIQTLLVQQRRFLADAAHELRTPITALSLQAENLESIELPEAARDRVEALKQGMKRTKQLLEQLLALARQEGASADRRQLPLIAIDSVAKEVIADLLPCALDHGIDMGFQLLEPAMVRAETVMVAAILRNLLDNALRFTPHGGNIDVGVYREGETAILQVEDTGPGVAPGDLTQIFEPFFCGSRPEGEGSGLGLSIVKRLVERLGGSILAENITGCGRSGLRVTVRFPLAANSAGSPTSAV
jgi:two-component system OmpR family sensor kinase